MQLSKQSIHGYVTAIEYVQNYLNELLHQRIQDIKDGIVTENKSLNQVNVNDLYKHLESVKKNYCELFDKLKDKT